MKSGLGLFLVWLSLFGSFCFGQEKSGPSPISMVELLAAPEKFDGQRIRVIGYLLIEQQPRHSVASFLFLHEEDAKHLLPHSVNIIPSERMIEDRERLHRMYVSITGTVAIVPSGGKTFIATIRNVEECYVWSNPARPKTDGLRERFSAPR